MQTADGSAIELIEDKTAFSNLQQELAGTRHLAFDTEFVRTNTFYANLGLIQLGDGHICYLVDPLAIDDDVALGNFLKSPNHCLILHSGSEDLNLLYTALGIVPAQLFDTQIAAAFLGLGYSLSYQALVRELLEIEIPKDETRSDWTKRPLSDTQKVYAATDVRYLLDLRSLLEDKLRAKGVLAWFQEECSSMLSVTPQAELMSSWEMLYTTITNAWRLNEKGLQFLQKLCVWREQEARHRNKPRNWIAKDADLLQISAEASKTPEPTLQMLLATAGVDKHVLKRYGSEISKLLTGPGLSCAAADSQELNPPLAGPSRKVLKACQRAVQEKAAELTIAPELLGRKKVILELVRKHEQYGTIDWASALPGWRREVLETILTPVLGNGVT